jgi:hypothetical protein
MNFLFGATKNWRFAAAGRWRRHHAIGLTTPAANKHDETQSNQYH